MKTDLMAELAEVVRLSGPASDDEPWQVDAEGDVVCNGEQVAWPITNKMDAPYIAALNNFLRTHHATLTRIIESEATLSADYQALVIRLHEVTTRLEVAERDAATERAIQNAAEKLPNGYFITMYIEAGSAYIDLSDGYDPVHIETDDRTLAEQINEAIATATHDSAREGS